MGKRTTTHSRVGYGVGGIIGLAWLARGAIFSRPAKLIRLLAALSGRMLRAVALVNAMEYVHRSLLKMYLAVSQDMHGSSNFMDSFASSEVGVE